MLKNYLHTSENKINRLPVVIDLFSGCGGLALGFFGALYKIAGGMDLDSAAVGTAAYNLYWSKGLDGRHICGDIRELGPEIFNNLIGKNGCIVIGGPPCQAYSSIGKGKLRSLGEDRSHVNDSRGTLFEDFLRYAIKLNARAVIMENVPESVNYGGLNVPQHACELLESEGYRAVWTVLNAADFGVPQIRERMFLIAVNGAENKNPILPAPTHQSPMDRQTPCQIRFGNFLKYKNFMSPLEPNSTCPEWITVGEAISDLPVLFPSASSKYNLYEPNVRLPYQSSPMNEYQKNMRVWCGEPQNQVSGNCFRRTVRDFSIFEKMKPGDNYKNASEIAEDFLKAACRTERIDEISDPIRYAALRRKIVPPYSRDKFHEKWKRLLSNRPSHTLVAHLSIDTYSHIHPWEPRGISVREAARLQSFPDGFMFQSSMGDAYKHIGNAVPPLLAMAIARAIGSLFTE